MTVSILKAELGGTIIDCLIYGLYLTLVIRSVQVLYAKEVHNRGSIYLYITSIILFCLITAHLALDVDRASRAFTENTGIPYFAEQQFNTVTSIEVLAKNATCAAVALIGDLFLIYRCFSAFGRKYSIIIIPFLIFIGNIATAILSALMSKHADTPSRVAEVISRVRYMYICTLALNLYCTISIAIRIWLVQRKSAGIGGSGNFVLMNAITIIVESAAIYSTFTIILIASAFYQSSLMYAILNPMPSIIGAVFSLIIVRVGSGRSTEKQSSLEFRRSRDRTTRTTMNTANLVGSILPTITDTVLFSKKTPNRSSIYLEITSIALFCLITAHLGLDIDRAFRAFTENTGAPDFAEQYFLTLTGSEVLAKNAAYATITLIADLFLTYRCFAAFGRNYFAIVVPSLLFIGNLVTATLAAVAFKQAHDGPGVAEVISRIKFMYICTLALNLWCTVSIAIKIWLVQRNTVGMDGPGSHVLGNTITIIVESAAVYSVFTIILIASAFYQSSLMYAILNPMPSIIGVVFSLIIVRVGSGKSMEKQSALEFRRSRNHTSRTTMNTSNFMGSILPTATNSVHVQLSGPANVPDGRDINNK
ncbi:hypothetical protein BDZ94DRAFT_1312928 [Collybia nuda]|uniref:Uncharacterized protein n=1 Tax=Collybia nuda TaxID=64659 RepID=A0A9P6CAU9_9AGAR|nr:hypothetical protein BDZ94DRAFT_1312928 [Collybia nuda]